MHANLAKRHKGHHDSKSVYTGGGTENRAAIERQIGTTQEARCDCIGARPICKCTQKPATMLGSDIASKHAISCKCSSIQLHRGPTVAMISANTRKRDFIAWSPDLGFKLNTVKVLNSSCLICKRKIFAQSSVDGLNFAFCCVWPKLVSI